MGSKWAAVAIETVESHNIHSREPSEKKEVFVSFFSVCVCVCVHVSQHKESHTNWEPVCVCVCVVDPPLWSQRAALIPENPISRPGLVMLVCYCVCVCVCVCVCTYVCVCWWQGIGGVGGVEDCVCGGLVYWITGPQLIQVGIISNKMWNSFNTQAVGRYQCVWQRFMCPEFRFLFFVQIVKAGFTLTDTWNPPN